MVAVVTVFAAEMLTVLLYCRDDLLLHSEIHMLLPEEHRRRVEAVESVRHPPD